MKFHIAFLFSCLIFLHELSLQRSPEAMINCFKSKKSKEAYEPEVTHTVSFLPIESESWERVVNLIPDVQKKLHIKYYTLRKPGIPGDGYEGVTFEGVKDLQKLTDFLNNSKHGKDFTAMVRETHKVNKGASSSGQARN